MRRLWIGLLFGALVLVPCEGVYAEGQAAALRKRARALEAEMAKLHTRIAQMAKEVARLRLGAELLEAVPKAAPKAKPKTAAAGLWGPPVRHAPKANLKQGFKKGADASTAEQAAAIVRKQTLADLRPVHRALLTDSRSAAEVLVVKGSFDRIGRALTHLQVPYTATTPWQLRVDKTLPFERHKVVLWNCGESLPKSAMRRIARGLRNFVEKGGYLYTTDWAILNVLQPAFPGRLATGGVKQHLPEMIVPITVSRGAKDSVYLRGVLPLPIQARWWIEQAAFDIKPKSTYRGVRLLEAAHLKDVFKRSSLVSTVFAHGKGRVLHTMGHAYQEAGNLAGAMAAQRLLLNFVLLARMDPGARSPDGLR